MIKTKNTIHCIFIFSGQSMIHVEPVSSSWHRQHLLTRPKLSAGILSDSAPTGMRPKPWPSSNKTNWTPLKQRTLLLTVVNLNGSWMSRWSEKKSRSRKLTRRSSSSIRFNISSWNLVKKTIEVRIDTHCEHTQGEEKWKPEGFFLNCYLFKLKWKHSSFFSQH